MWRETRNTCFCFFDSRYFNPLPPCGGRQSLHRLCDLGLIISIHSLRVEGDAENRSEKPAENHFNPLPPCGGRQSPADVIPVGLLFQSTPSVWRETVKKAFDESRKSDFNPLPPCGGRPVYFFSSGKYASISIHSLRVEGDIGKQSDGRHWSHFNPLPPCGGRHMKNKKESENNDFNPLPPCGGRHD